MPRLNWSLTIPTVISKSWNVVRTPMRSTEAQEAERLARSVATVPWGFSENQGVQSSGETTTLEIGHP